MLPGWKILYAGSKLKGKVENYFKMYSWILSYQYNKNPWFTPKKFFELEVQFFCEIKESLNMALA